MPFTQIILQSPFPGQSVRPSTAVDTIESRVGIASEFPADGRARQSTLSGCGSLVDTFTTPLFDVEPALLNKSELADRMTPSATPVILS